jgi:hypothetical protein
MKTTFISLMALGVAAAMAGPADRALADQPTVLTDAELDRVTAGGEALATLVINKLGAAPSPNTADNVDIEFGRAEERIILQLELATPGRKLGGPLLIVPTPTLAAKPR